MAIAGRRALWSVLIGSLALGRPAFAQQHATLESTAIRTLADSIFNAALIAKRFTSAALIVVDGDRILVKRGYGWTDAAHRHVVDPDSTVFNAASVSKVFAATALMQLADQRRLDLRAPIAPRLTRIRMLGPHASQVTAEHLLTHTAGLDAKFLGALMPAGTAQPRLEDYFLASPPRVVRTPGSAVAYSNVGAALEGYVVEAITGQPFYEYAEHAIFAPLGMTMSSFRQPLPGRLETHRPATDRRSPFFRPYPAASLATTPADMGRFLIALLNGGRIGDSVLLSEHAVSDMLAPHWRAQPAVPGVALGFFESFGPAGRALFHTGDGGHHSLIYFVPERRFGFYAVYAAGDEEASRLREELVATLIAGALGARASDAMPEPPGDFAMRARQYVGTYRSNSYSHFTLEKISALPMQLSIASDGTGGALLARQFGGDGHARLVEIAADAFRTSDGGYAAFRRDSAGRVTSIVFSGSIWDPSTADRAAWYDRAEVQLGALLLAGLTFVARLLAGGVRRFRQHRGRDAPAEFTSWRLSGALSLLFVTAPLIAPLGLFTGRPPFYSPPWSIYACLIVLLVACVLGVVVLGVAWRERRSHTRVRMERTLVWAVGFASLIVTACLWNWNLLGIRV